ncbi:MAG: zinc ribbon domain-containing protein [Dehalococcoidales bacterium]|nr:zinc ribbon domain-containing protein [Dehalococcoidales bacterium]MDP7525854.1 zinc ribbon domain-containing protein [Dehalococcoidales bacterium]
MPIYEYECPNCSCRFEKKRSFTDEGPVPCPECQCEGQRIFSAVPIIFKGSGFYVTDHRGNHGHSEPASNPDEAKTEDTDTSKAGNTSETKADSAEPTS